VTFLGKILNLRYVVYVHSIVGQTVHASQVDETKERINIDILTNVNEEQNSEFGGSSRTATMRVHK
jgi:hypothetical protein